MGVEAWRSTKKADKIQTCPTLSNHLTENMITRRRLVNGIEKDLTKQKRKTRQAGRLKYFKKDSSTPIVKYTNRKYKTSEARKECNQGMESFKSTFEVLKECGCGYLGP